MALSPLLKTFPPSSNALPINSTIVINPDLRHVELDIEKHLKQELDIKLDTDQQICPRHLNYISSLNQSLSSLDHRQESPCQLGSECPFRHVIPSSLNFNSSTQNQNNNHHPNSSHSKTVCKHWLRGLCKKGNLCEFLHEYNLRTMPECWFFGKYGFCSNGDECMYLHVDERMRVLECMDFRRGFCPKGPGCSQKHIRRPLCRSYLAGFCPYEKSCHLGGHPKFEADPTPRGNPYINSFNPFDRPRGDPDRLGAHNSNGLSNLKQSIGVNSGSKHHSPLPHLLHHQQQQQQQPFISTPQQQQKFAHHLSNNPLNPQLIQHQINLKTNHILNNNPPINPSLTSNNNHTIGLNPLNEDNWIQTDAGPRKKRNLDEVTCFKCGQKGHYANVCPNPMVPGNRGGVIRGPGGRLLGDENPLPPM